MPESPPSPSPRRAAMAVDALRRGWMIRVGALDLLSVESCALATYQQLADEHGAPLDMLISGERAEVLKITNQRAAAGVVGGAVRLAAAAVSLEAAMHIADPSLDLHYPLKGPFVAIPCAEASEASEDIATAQASANAAIVLARRAGLLPAFFIIDRTSADGSNLTESNNTIACVVQSVDVEAFLDPRCLSIVTRARLPTAASAQTEIVAFRSPEDSADHIALLFGQRDSSAPLVRVHSECLTGDVLSSLKCDCGEQLAHALAALAQVRWGVLLYLRQEGRGIGLINKLRAYTLQDQGFDTVDANLRLGFPVEARDFSIAAQMLSLLEISKVRLLTNNPNKVAWLEQGGIAVEERLPLAVPTNLHNAHYLATKRDRTGHQL